MDQMNASSKVVNKEKNAKVKKMDIRLMVSVAMLGGISVVLMLFEVPLWFAPPFYKIDLSEVPVLIGAFVFGPMAGVLVELIKILLNLLINSSTTAGVGEMANFVIGCSYIIPAGYLYKKMKNKKGACIGMITGVITMVVIGCLINAYVLLPAYSKAFGMGMDQLIQMGSVVNPSIKDLTTFVMLIVAPFNLIKGCVVSIITFLLYKKISVIMTSSPT